MLLLEPDERENLGFSACGFGDLWHSIKNIDGLWCRALPCKTEKVKPEVEEIDYETLMSR